MTTLDYFKTHPLRVCKPQPELLVGQVLTSEKATVCPKSIHPSAGAFIHYGGVELADMLTITKPSLTDDQLLNLTSNWYKSCGQVAKQLLFYTASICSKEMKHGSTSKCDKAFGNWSRANEEGMSLAMELCMTISNGGSYKTHLSNHGDVKASLYMDAVERQFRNGGWGGAYGGPKWANITLEICRYYQGKTSAMIAADRCWTLVHNTGPIFNKGFYFQHHDSNLMQILNAQATTSVFDLGTDFLTKNSEYAHETSSAFNSFTGAATKAIQQVKSDYTAGSTGGINSDGSKPTKGKTGSTVKGVTITKIGPFVLQTSTDRDALI